MIEFESNAFRSSWITHGGLCHIIELPEYQPIYPHGGPNHEKLALKNSPRPNSRVDPPPHILGSLVVSVGFWSHVWDSSLMCGILVLCMRF